MLERWEYGLDAVRRGGLPPGYAADRNVDSLEANPNAAQAARFEVTPKGSSSPPLPLDLSEYPEPFQSLGWERLLPYDLGNPGGLGPYQIYLEEFYNIHKNSDDVAARAPLKCMAAENNLEYIWGKFSNFSFPSDIASLSKGIKECMVQFMVKKGDESEHPFVKDAAACIAEEAELMVDWQMRGFDLPSEEYILSHKIRQLAYEHAMFKGEWSAEIAAPLLGIRKEAEWLRENMECGSSESIETSRQIREFALLFLQCNFEAGWYTSEGSIEASDIDDVWTDEEDDSWESGDKRCITKSIIIKLG